MDDIKTLLEMCKSVGLNGPSLVIAGLAIYFSVKYGPSIIQGHLEHLKISGETQNKLAETMSKLDEKVGAKMELHSRAIGHTADGLIAHVDGRPDDAKQLAAKAKEAVK